MHRGSRGRPGRRIALVCAVAFFFAPLAARIAGQHAIELEKHKLAAFPSVQSWKFFSAFDQWSIDHLPLRQYAVHGNAKLSEALFGQPPSYGGNADSDIAAIGTHQGQKPENPKPADSYTRVLQGKNGWLFLGDDVSNACEGTAPVSLALERIDLLGKAIEASGRRFIFTIAPDKTNMEQDELPDQFYGKGCLTRREDALWAQLRDDPPTGYLDLRGPLERTQQRDGVPLYWKSDSHWTSRGAVVFAQQLANRLDPSLWQGSSVEQTGPAHREGDLSDLLGAPRTDTSPGWTVRRPGVHLGYTQAPAVTQRPTRIHNTTTGVPLFKPPTMLLGDSFTDTSRRVLYPLFSDVTPLHNLSSLGFPDLFSQTLIHSDVVVLEVVERSMLTPGGPSIGTPKYRGRIQSVLAHHPLTR